MLRASVLFPLPLPEPFDYTVPPDMGVSVGSHVLAPIGPHLRRGVIWSLRDDGTSGPSNLKSLERVFDAPAVPEAMRSFLSWAAKYLVTHEGALLAMALRVPEALEPSPVQHKLSLAAENSPLAKPTPARLRVLAAAKENNLLSRTELASRASVSQGVVAGLVREGVLAEVAMPTDVAFDQPNPSHPGNPLSPAQAAAAERVTRTIAAKGFATVLLDGVTGSGKTEVYLEAVAATLTEDPQAQVLILLPEIALTQAIFARIEARFGAQPAPWHSDLTPPQRRRSWREIAHGRARIVVGARSALFLPFANLRLIIVDEEHDGSFKQTEGLRYHARDMAVSRAKFENCPIVLASATPSLETLANVEAGRYRRVRLPSRFGNAILPAISLVDLKENRPESGRWLSPPLVTAIVETLERREQVLLFLNRRGYAPLVLCRACGHRMKAPDTDSWLVEHRYTGRLVCHMTGFSMPKPKACPACGTQDSLVSVGPGVERVAEEAIERFPDARIEVLSSDIAHSPAAIRAMVQRMEAGDIDILIGTQIVAKGHNFPGLTLVGVVDADLSLRGGDLRAGERTYQLLAQVAGRAGRADRPGRALIQTHYPEHPALLALAMGDRDGFLHAESSERAGLGMPPFGRLAAVHLMAREDDKLEAAAKALSQAMPAADDVEVWGPAPPPLAMVRGWKRLRFLIKAGRNVDLSAFLRHWRDSVKLSSAVRIAIDIEPYDFL